MICLRVWHRDESVVCECNRCLSEGVNSVPLSPPIFERRIEPKRRMKTKKSRRRRITKRMTVVAGEKAFHESRKSKVAGTPSMPQPASSFSRESRPCSANSVSIPSTASYRRDCQTTPIHIRKNPPVPTREQSHRLKSWDSRLQSKLREYQSNVGSKCCPTLASRERPAMFYRIATASRAIDHDYQAGVGKLITHPSSRPKSAQVRQPRHSTGKIIQRKTAPHLSHLMTQSGGKRHARNNNRTLAW
jgi:hypothetical protein